MDTRTKEKKEAQSIFDAILLGTQETAEFIAGHATDGKLDPLFVQAFQLQYPNVAEHTSLVDFVQSKIDDPNSLQGALNGIEGKYFELHNLDNLNQHLTDGLHAELADSATQPGYDYVIYDHDHNVVDYIQSKVNLSDIYEHADKYPEIHNVLTTSDHVEQHIDGINYIDSGMSTDELNQHMNTLVDGSQDQVNFHFPYLAASAILVSAIYAYNKGTSTEDIISMVAERATGTAIGSITNIILAPFTPFVSVPASMAARFLWSKSIHRLKVQAQMDKKFADEFRFNRQASEKANKAVVLVNDEAEFVYDQTNRNNLLTSSNVAIMKSTFTDGVF